MLAITTKVLKQYFKIHKDESKMISFAFPVTFKAIPEDPKDYVYHNMFGSTSLYVSLTDDFSKALKNATKIMNDLKSSPLPAATMTLIQFYNLFCSNGWVSMINKEAGKKHSLLYSNIAGFN